MNRLITLENMVHKVLTENKRARDDDRELALCVWMNYYNVNPYAPVVDVMHNRKLPSQESIGRARRKIQEKDESLRGSKHKEQIRLDAQVDYLEYAKR